VTFDVTTPDTDVTSGLALYQDAAGVWRSAALTVAGGHARGSGALPGDTQAAGVAFVQLVDAGGNVGLATDKGEGFALSPASDPGANAPPLLADPLPNPDGTTTGPVTVRITGDARATAKVSVDGAAFVAYEAPIVLETSGVHVITAQAPDGSTSRLTIVIADVTPPAKPTLTSTTPASPSTDDHPRVKGAAPDAASVVLYAGSDCTGTPIGEGSATDFAGAGIPVTVAQNATTTLRAVAVGALGQRSECSTSTLTYVNDVVAPNAIDTTPKTGPVLGKLYAGTATDNLAGVDRVEIRIESRGNLVMLTADLTCDASRRSCTWSKKLPTVATTNSTVRVTAIDRVGLRDPTPIVRQVPK